MKIKIVPPLNNFRPLQQLTPDSLMLLLLMKIKHGLPDDVLALVEGYPDGKPINTMLTKVNCQEHIKTGPMVLQCQTPLSTVGGVQEYRSSRNPFIFIRLTVQFELVKRLTNKPLP